MRRACALFAVAICLCSCESINRAPHHHMSNASWADAPCPPGHAYFTANGHLTLIGLLARNAGPYRARIEAAAHTCRLHHVEGSWETGKHCRYVQRALRFALFKKWQPCLNNLLHDEQASKFPGRKYRKRTVRIYVEREGVPAEGDCEVKVEWLNTPCPSGMMAGEMLDLIELLVSMPPPIGPEPSDERDADPDSSYRIGDPLGAVVKDLVNRCRCHRTESEYLSVEDHCVKLERAFAHAMLEPRDWQACADELDHMVTTK